MKQTVIPQLRITNADQSLAFYVESLGFSVDWRHQFEAGYPLFMQLTRDGQTIFLTEHTGDCQVGGAVYFKVPNVDEFSRAVMARGLTRFEAPKVTPWGTKEMLLIDPDGNRLRFATDMENA